MILKKIVALAFLLTTINCIGQDVMFGRKVVDTLTSPYFWGRGYTNDGMQKAAKYIADTYTAVGLLPLKGSPYLQPFTYPVNTFAGKMEVAINGKPLRPGVDFIVAEESSGYKGDVTLEQADSSHFVNQQRKVLVEIKDKLTWSVSPEASGYTSIYVDTKAIESSPKTINLNIENKQVSSFKAANVCGFIKGTLQPDSLIIITAHYDHLGGMGSTTYFPGANDNASGIAVLLGLADYYAKNRPEYSIAFICFAGEEAGLLGSKYFTQHPLIPLGNIKFLTNIDLAGTGEEGITVVNATEFATEYKILNAVNDSGKFLIKINARGKAANSDHYWFTELGVPSFFIYTLGGIKAYHDVFDKSQTLPLNEYEDLIKLMVGFNDRLMKRY